MAEKLDSKRIIIFLTFAFGIAWSIALVIFLTGGLVNSAELIPGTSITLAFVLIAGIYMFAPAAANVITRLVTREGWKDTWLRPNFRIGKRFWLIAWLGTASMVLLSAVPYFVLFPQYFDPELTVAVNMIAAQEAQTGEALPLTPTMLIAVQIIQAIILAPILNLVPILGEEFGWRAYLQPKLMLIGWRKAMLWMGIIWGLWHLPIIMMGHNYGLDYPGAPWLGPIVFTWFTFTAGIFLGWLTIQGKSVWPAVIGHSIFNGLAAIVSLVTRGNPNPLIGPSVAGLIGGLGFSILGLWLLLREDPTTINATNSES